MEQFKQYEYCHNINDYLDWELDEVFGIGDQDKPQYSQQLHNEYQRILVANYSSNDARMN